MGIKVTNVLGIHTFTIGLADCCAAYVCLENSWTNWLQCQGCPPGDWDWKKRDLDHQAIAPTECSLRQSSGWVPRDVKIYKRVSGCLQGFCGLMEQLRSWKITLEVKFQLFYFMWPEIFQKLINWIIWLLKARFWRTHLSHCPFNNNEASGLSLVVQMIKNLSAMWETWVWCLGGEDLL